MITYSCTVKNFVIDIFGLVDYTPGPYGVWLLAPSPPGCTARYCTKHEIKPRHERK